MHILVIGGTGFIGYHIVQELISSGHEVTLLCRTPDKARKIFGDVDIKYIQGNLVFFHDIKFDALFRGVDALIYATGTDERDVPDDDAYAFFYEGNVTTCINMLEKAKQHHVKRAIILGSIFTYLDRNHPELKLSVYHPYIRSRAEQQKQAMKLSDESFIVNIIEVPFVFGHTQDHGTLWKSLVNYIRVMNPLIVTPGGANCISVESVGKATLGVLNYIHESGPVAIGDENLTWVNILERISAIANTKQKQIYLLERGIFSDLTRLGAYFHEFFGMRSGLDQRHISELINLEGFLNTKDIKKKLHYEGGDLDTAFYETVKACPKTLLVNNLQRSIDWINENTLKNFNIIKKIKPKT